LITEKIKEIVWHARVISPETPWVTLVIPDNDQNKRAELTGTIGSHK
jgi:hypothetical protein